MRQARQHLTYANVAATLALFLVLSSGVAFAATKISTKNIKAGAIKTKQLAAKSVTTGKLAPGAVKSGKIAPGAVGGTQLAAGAVGSTQLAPNSVNGSHIIDGSITPSDLAPGVPSMLNASTAATATGGPVSVATGAEEEEGEEGEEEPGPAQIPLTGGTWTQGPQEHNIYLAQVEATLQAEEGEECGVEVTLNVDGEPVGTIAAVLPEAPEEEEGEEEGEEEEVPPAPSTVTRGQVSGPSLATGAAQTRVMTATAVIGEDAVCESAQVKSLKVVVLGIG